MLIWILVAIAALGLAGFAFVPRRRRVVDDRAARRARRRTEGHIEDKMFARRDVGNGPIF